MNELFKYLHLETISTCNRTCPTCIRNSHLDRKKLRSWFKPHYLSINAIKEAFIQCVDLQFTGEVCLSHYNEPLLDERIPELAILAKSFGFFVFLNTNGDYLTNDLMQKLDGKLDRIIVSLYMDEPIKSKRAAWIQSSFQTTEAHVIIQSDHVATHFSPKFDVKALAAEYIDHRCTQPQTGVIINHRQQYLLCCDDVIGNFDLGYFPNISIKDFWFGEKHIQIMNDLDSGNRSKYSYCSTCPRN